MRARLDEDELLGVEVMLWWWAHVQERRKEKREEGREKISIRASVQNSI